MTSRSISTTSRCRMAASATLAEVRRIGIVEPDDRSAETGRDRQVSTSRSVAPVREIVVRARRTIPNPSPHFDFVRYLCNSVFVTVTATLITLVVNSMAAFALSANTSFAAGRLRCCSSLPLLMVPLSVIMVPLYSIVSALGLFNYLWGVILPTVATPTGVFMLRQYMLTIPDELIDAARMDKASEWQIYWRIILPLDRARARRACDLFRGLALERLPLAADRAVAQGTLYAAGWPQHLFRRSSMCSGITSWR